MPFEAGYPLPSLEEVRRHIAKQGRLSGVPAAAAATNGRNGRTYYAAGTQTLGLAYAIGPGGVVTARASDRVRLAPGFRAESGSVFRTLIVPVP